MIFQQQTDSCLAISSGVATPGPTRAQAWAKLVCALVAKAQVPAINIFFIGLGGRRTGISKFSVTGPTRCPGNFTSLDTPLAISVYAASSD